MDRVVGICVTYCGSAQGGFVVFKPSESVPTSGMSSVGLKAASLLVFSLRARVEKGQGPATHPKPLTV